MEPYLFCYKIVQDRQTYRCSYILDSLLFLQRLEKVLDTIIVIKIEMEHGLLTCFITNRLKIILYMICFWPCIYKTHNVSGSDNSLF